MYSKQCLGILLLVQVVMNIAVREKVVKQEI